MYILNIDTTIINKYYKQYKDCSLEKLNDMLFLHSMKDIWTEEDFAFDEALTKLIKGKNDNETN